MEMTGNVTNCVQGPANNFELYANPSMLNSTLFLGENLITKVQYSSQSILKHSDWMGSCFLRGFLISKYSITNLTFQRIYSPFQ